MWRQVASWLRPKPTDYLSLPGDAEASMLLLNFAGGSSNATTNPVAAAPTGSQAAIDEARQRWYTLEPGTRVHARRDWTGKFRPGRVRWRNNDDTYAVAFDDGVQVRTRTADLSCVRAFAPLFSCVDCRQRRYSTA